MLKFDRAVLVGAAAWATPDNLESVFILADEKDESWHDGGGAAVGESGRGTNKTDMLLMPVLSAFLRREYIDGEILRDQKRLLQLQGRAERDIAFWDNGFAIKHLGLVGSAV